MSTHEPILPPGVYGVDFSSAVNAGRTIWIAGGEVVHDVLHCTICLPAAELPDSGKDRATALAALRDFILQQTPCAVGCDFPFSLPQEIVTEPSWEAFVHEFASRHPDAASFKRWCAERAGGRELRRVTDREARTPFSAYNLRLYRQTYYGIRCLLAPLIATGRVSVLPMQPPAPGQTWLLEICPASTLKRLGLYAPYKRRDAAPVREGLLNTLTRDGRVEVSNAVRDAVIRDHKGDALDSVIAAITTWRVLPDASLLQGNDGSLAAIEGHVFV
jgi:hypothetical protein